MKLRVVPISCVKAMASNPPTMSAIRPMMMPSTMVKPTTWKGEAPRLRKTAVSLRWPSTTRPTSMTRKMISRMTMGMLKMVSVSVSTVTMRW